MSAGFGYDLTKQLLKKGDTVIGTVRSIAKAEEFITEYKNSFDCRILEVTDVPLFTA